MTAVFLQARRASNRFPDKILTPFLGTTVLRHAMSQLDHVSCNLYAILTDLESLSAVSEAADTHFQATGNHWEVFAGHPTDVSHRFIEAAKLFKVDTIVRATGDNPLVDPALANILLQIHSWGTADATRPFGATPGTASEIINASALIRDYPDSTPDEREHVMPATYRMGKTNIIWTKPLYPAPVTIDTHLDLARTISLYSKGYTNEAT